MMGDHDEGSRDDTSLALVLHAILSAQRQPSLQERLAGELQRQAEQTAIRSAPAMAELNRQQYDSALRQSVAMNAFAPILPEQAARMHSLVETSHRQRLQANPYAQSLSSHHVINAGYNTRQLDHQHQPGQLQNLLTSLIRQQIMAPSSGVLSRVAPSALETLASSHVGMASEHMHPSSLAANGGSIRTPSDGVNLGDQTLQRRRRRAKRPRPQQSIPAPSSEHDQLDNMGTANHSVGSIETGGNNQAQNKRRQNPGVSFPVKLWQMIEDAKAEGRHHLIQFTSDGTAVQFSAPYDLEEHLFPKYFRHQNFASFKRQLSMYGFVRILEGENKDAFAHPLFLKCRPDLVEQIKRVSELG